MDMDLIARKLFSGGFDLEQSEKIKEGDEFIDYQILPYISDRRSWEQYGNEVLYDAEKRLRVWLQEMSQSATFRNKRGARTYKFSQVFRILYGRPYDSKIDGRYSTMLSRLFRYYCTRTSKNYYDKETGKTQSKTSFVFAVSRLKKPPYSLRLRLEWLAERGVLPSAANMKLPKDIEIGECRNPNTEANRAKQREAGRERYNEYQRKLRAEHNEGRPVRPYNRRTSSGHCSDEDNR